MCNRRDGRRSVREEGRRVWGGVHEGSIAGFVSVSCVGLSDEMGGMSAVVDPSWEAPWS